MRCTTYCTAAAYSLSDIKNYYRERYPVAHYRDSLHLSYQSGHVYLFAYGCLVCWGLDESEEKTLLQELQAFEKDPNDKIEVDYVRFNTGTHAVIQRDIVTVPENDQIMAKLAISYGLAQQVKLSVFESRIDETITNTKQIPKSLAKNGIIPMSRRDIARKIGLLFIVRSSVNLHSDILDTPEFFWEYPSLEPLYQMTAGYFSVVQRTEVLNKRCNMLYELFQMLSEDLATRSSVRVEWVIVGLISIEIFLTLIQLFKFIE